jgi:hypothetical protein
MALGIRASRQSFPLARASCFAALRTTLEQTPGAAQRANQPRFENRS